jgi:beta-glucosidase
MRTTLLLEREISAGQPGAVLEPALLSVIGTMPMSTLAGSGGTSLAQDRLDEVTREWQEAAGAGHHQP